jgi:hypothetical protein
MSTREYPGVPWSTLTSLLTRAVPLRGRARPPAVRLRCRAPRGTAGERRRHHTCACVYIPTYTCACIYICRVYMCIYNYLCTCVYLYLGHLYRYTHRTVPAQCRHTRAPVETRARASAACGGGAPVVSASAAHSSSAERPAPTACVLKYALLEPV